MLIVPEKAVGQRQIVDACPYGAVFWNEEKQLPQAWPFDAHLLDTGLDADARFAGLSDAGHAHAACDGR